jgi:hypothetical protein
VPLRRRRWPHPSIRADGIRYRQRLFARATAEIEYALAWGELQQLQDPRVEIARAEASVRVDPAGQRFRIGIEPAEA